MSDSVGKISLDLEVQSDINGQISEVANNMTKQMKTSIDGLVKSGFKNINKDVKSSMDSVTKTIDASMKNTTDKIKSAASSMSETLKGSMEDAAQDIEERMGTMAENMTASIEKPLGKFNPKRLIDGLLDKFRMKEMPAPTYDAPESTSMPTSNIVSTDTVRGPPAEDTSRVITLKNQIEETRLKADQLRQELAQMEMTQVPTKECADLEKQIQKAETALLNLLNRQERMEESGVRRSSASYKSLQNDIQAAEKTILNLEAAMENLKAADGAFLSGSGTEEYAKKEAQLNGLVGKMDAYKAKLSEVQTKEESATKGTGKFVTALNGVQQICKKVTSGIEKLGGFFKNLIGKLKQAVTHSDRAKKSFNGTQGSANSLGKSILNLGNMFKLLLLRMVMRGVIQGAKEGFQNLAQYSNTVNESISSVMSSLTRLKNSFATAFAPILNVVAPIITKFINMLADAITYVGMFFAALTGQKYFTKANKVVENYADGLRGSADDATKGINDTDDAAKKLLNTLTSFDQAEVIQFDNENSNSNASSGSGNSDSDSGAGTSIGEMFDTVKIDSWLSDMASKFKSVLSDIFAPIKQAWADYGQGVMDAWKYALDEVWGLIKDIGATWLKVWTNGAGYETVKNVLLLLEEIGLWIGDVAKAWRAAWDKYGEELVWAIFELLNAILVLMRSISTAFRNVWNDGVGERICGLILQIITNIVQTVTNLTTRFTEAWNEGGRGERIAAAIFFIIERILIFINNIAEATKEWAAKLDFGPLLEAIGGFLEKIGTVIDNIAGDTESFYNSTVLPFLTWLIEDALPSVIDLFGDVAVWLSDHQGVVWAVIAVWAAFKLAIAACNGLMLVYNASLAAQKISEGLATVGRIAHTVATHAHTAATWLATAATTAFGVAMSVLTSPITLVIAAIAAIIAIIVLLVKNWDWVKEKASDVWGGIKDIFSGFGEFLSGAFTKDWTESFGVFGEGLNVLFKGVGDVWEGIKEIFSGFIKFFKGVFTGDWASAWEGIKDIFKGIWDAMIGIIKVPVNAIIGFINGLITGIAAAVNAVADMLNSIQFDVPDWVPFLGGKSFGFNLQKWEPAKIPLLARGGVINAPTLAMVGEGSNNEAVVPLENNPAWVDYLNSQFGLKNGAASNGSVTKEELETIINSAANRIIAAISEISNMPIIVKEGGNAGGFIQWLKIELEKASNCSGIRLVESKVTT